jgi:hypothetical protein
MMDDVQPYRDRKIHPLERLKQGENLVDAAERYQQCKNGQSQQQPG